MINRVIISPEAILDYEEAVVCRPLDRRLMCDELEEYIDRIRTGAGYFRCKYIDEASGKQLMLFVYRENRQMLFQNWLVRGICDAEDWNEDAEYYGNIRYWINSSVTELPKTDWVWRLRVWQEKQDKLRELLMQE